MTSIKVRSHFLNRATLFAALLLFCVTSVGQGASPPDFKLKDLDGNWFTLGDHLGKEVIYVTFWATWCVPCRREMPHLEELANDFGDQGFLVLGINTDPPATKSKIKPYLRRLKVTYLNVLDPNNNVLDKYNPTRELPYAILIDRKGDVHEIYPGYRAGDEIRLREAVEALLGADNSTDDTGAGE